MQYSQKRFMEELRNNSLPEHLKELELPEGLKKSIIKDYNKGLSPGFLPLRMQQYLDDCEKAPILTTKELEAKLIAAINAKKEAEADIASIVTTLEEQTPQNEFMAMMEKHNLLGVVKPQSAN